MHSSARPSMRKYLCSTTDNGQGGIRPGLPGPPSRSGGPCRRGRPTGSWPARPKAAKSVSYKENNVGSKKNCFLKNAAGFKANTVCFKKNTAVRVQKRI